MPGAITHGSLFAGIGGFDLGFERAGFKTIWQVEKEPFCRAVLKTHFPDVEQFEDVTECGSHNLKRVDIITGGFPCQDISVAGRRAGLAGERSGLFFEAARILRELRPAWFVLENVPGLFSSNGGRDFAEILRVLMVECGYGVQWRVLDSQFFGVAQRRRRVFIVGHLGAPCPAAILFERESGQGNSAESGEAGTDVAYALAASVRGSGDGHGNGWNSNYVTGAVKGSSLSRRTVNSEEAADGFLVPAISSKWAKGSGGPSGDECQNLVAATLSASSHDRSHAAGRRREDDINLVAHPLTASRGHHGHSSERGDGSDNLVCGALGGIRKGGPDDNSAQQHHIISVTLHAGIGRNHIEEEYVPMSAGVRRLTPTECEVLQGFPRGWTIPAHKFSKFEDDPDWPLLPRKLDSPRYRALGNAVTVNVAEWLGRRIAQCTR